jgi:large conductance mechanosensitive channel
MLEEFKKFVMRGNVLDLAVGVIIGGAFGKIVSSLVGDILMPLVGLVMGGVNFTDLFISLDGGKYETLQSALDAGAGVLAYGAFIQNIIDFLIIAFVIFLIVRTVNKMTEKPAAAEAPAAPTTKECAFCASTIPEKAKRCPNCTSMLD